MFDDGADNAPLHEDVARGPEGGQAWWLTTTDGTRIRLALWPHPSAKGTVLMFPGRTEYIEKYGLVAADLHAAGYAVACVDWRGQGLADRAVDPRDVGHVGDFLEYQQDVEALMAALSDMANAPRPWHMLAHSMGGCIGLRALYRGLDVQGVAFSAPMWGIQMTGPQKLAAEALRWLSPILGLGEKFAPTTGPHRPGDFATNRITTDRDQFDYMEFQTDTYPHLALGGPSADWMLEALEETGRLMTLPAPDCPVLTFLGTEEKITDPEAIKDYMASWPGGVLEIVDGAEHEVLMEAPHMRDPVMARIIDWFDNA